MQPIRDTVYAVGIVSSGRYQCDAGYPAIYTKVEYYLDFIEQYFKIPI